MEFDQLRPLAALQLGVFLEALLNLHVLFGEVIVEHNLGKQVGWRIAENAVDHANQHRESLVVINDDLVRKGEAWGAIK